MKYKEIAVDSVLSRSDQVRQDFSEASIDKLANSIAEVGQLQPIVVQQQKDHYLLIAGERRLRAVQKQGKTKIAAVILTAEISAAQFTQIQLVENLQRQDLNPLERALAIRKFMQDNNLNKKTAAKQLGVARTTLTLWLNILNVKEKYQQEVLKEDSPITLSHLSLATALAAKTCNPVKKDELLEAVLKYNLSRKECKAVTDIYAKYLHLPMSEAVAAILLKREHLNLKDHCSKNTKHNSNQSIRRLLKAFTNVNDNLEEFMEQQGEISAPEQDELLDEFLYLYQIMGILIPDLNKKSLPEFIDHLKEK